MDEDGFQKQVVLAQNVMCLHVYHVQYFIVKWLSGYEFQILVHPPFTVY
jgi:hypothetical protein